MGGSDIRRKVDELAVRWKMKEPGRADQTTEYSSVPLLDSNADDLDDQVRGLWCVLCCCAGLCYAVSFEGACGNVRGGTDR